MKRLILLTTIALVTLFASTSARQVITPTDISLDGSYEIQAGGDLTAYMRSLTSRHVSGDLRFLSMTHTGRLLEFSIAGLSFGQRVTTTTNSWDLSSIAKDFTGIYYEESSSRLFVTGSTDYTTVTTPAWVKTLTLNSNGTISNLHSITLSNLNEKRMYGGCLPIPTKWQAQWQGKYACGWGGYTSLTEQGGGAAMGPVIVAIPDPATIADGGSVAAVILLDSYSGGTRGYRKTLPLNYFDGGDTDANGVRRENPQTPPTRPPWPAAGWLSPNDAGKGWFVWGDSYYNNAFIVGDTYGAIAALCGVPGQTPDAGKCWYQTSTLHFDGRTAEVHLWDMAGIDGTNKVVRPTTMAELAWPRGITGSWDGNVPMANISGVTIDSATGKLYAVGYPLGTPSGGVNATWDMGRLYRASVNTGGTPVTPPGPPTPPSPTPINCVGSWSAPVVISTSSCVNSQQNVISRTTFTITTPAQYGGTACSAANGAFVDTTTTQACNVPNVCASPHLSIAVSKWPVYAGRNSGSWSVSGAVGDQNVTFRLTRTIRTATVVDSRGCSAVLTKY